ncbi:hypothetical protein RAJCM14343_5517 [Rhodococcus aetherivorans]|uniref:DUF3263 domain-containing protein n=1 Tax=Rhodococcus aetherivorans TaxID=191292 RepID=A0ABQ0YUE2_9NOCA|nr:DUF3263 domain-containing protein [Rhodococcus aetherivorans]ETT23374.1 Protein of unknown function DUF3263 [Rhodococcus rhodochrous ATCC 21198]KDE12088.1 hypothetical protein N505_0117490 [Rhodococcus aetherivorans]MDV6293590.1 DUF3263 domain-containing protein [Rhodococcus aetherivorans]NGP28101.1 DUF3263 domain-containing protein [Rhodococcus aetherivorans]GES40234.1 hypothetical protein RAJCM14343_5517 [Rhodococcus aetherivorans]
MDGAAAQIGNVSEQVSDRSNHAENNHAENNHPAAGPDEAGTDGLSRRERDILAFERQWWKYAGAKEEAIKELFGLSATRYYQVLNALVDRPEALAADPMLVKRLRRLRASRQKARAARRLGFEITK